MSFSYGICKRSPKLMYLPSNYKHKVTQLKQLVKEAIIENSAMCDVISEIQEQILIRVEERKFLLRKLCTFDSQVEIEVQRLANVGFPQPSAIPSDSKKGKKKANEGSTKTSKPRRSSAKIRKKIVQPIPLDSSGRPVFPIVLGNLTIHSLGDVLSDPSEFHCEDAIYPAGYVSTRIYGSLKDPTVKCMYTCKISDANGLPRFEIAPDNDDSSTIVGGSPDICHSILLQRVNDALSLNVVSTRPRGNDFFGLTHPTVLNLIQSSPGSRKCSNYKWSKFEVLKNGDHHIEDADASLNFDSLQRSINICKYKMGSNMYPRQSDGVHDGKNHFNDYFSSLQMRH